MKLFTSLVAALSLSGIAIANYSSVSHIGSVSEDWAPSISADGTKVAYLCSNSSGALVIDLYDATTSTTTQISGTAIYCHRPRISRDGGAVTFMASPVGYDTLEPFVWTSTGGLVQVAAPTLRAAHPFDLSFPAPGISDNTASGYYIVYQDLSMPMGNARIKLANGGYEIGTVSDNSDNATSPDIDAAADEVVYTETGQIVMATASGGGSYSYSTISINNLSVAGNGTSDNASIDAAGDLVAFDTSSTNLSSSDVNGVRDVYLRDLSSGSTRQAYTLYTSTTPPVAGDSTNPQLSSNGTLLVFQTNAQGLLPSVYYSDGMALYNGPYCMLANATSSSSGGVEITSIRHGLYVNSGVHARNGNRPTVSDYADTAFDSMSPDIVMSYSPTDEDVFYLTGHY